MRDAADPSIKTLIGRLGTDAKRLLSDEVRLARLEVAESGRHLSRGLAGVAAAFGISVIAATGATVLAITVVGTLTGRLWIGALGVGLLEIFIGAMSYNRGRRSLKGKLVAP